MRKTFYTIIFLSSIVLSTSLLTSCGCITGNGPVVKSEREIRSANHLIIEVDGDIIIHQSDTASLFVTTQSNIQKHIRISKRGDKITVKASRCFTQAPPLTIEIGLPNFESLTVNSSAKVQSKGKKIDAESFNIVSNKDAIINLNISTVDMHVTAGGRTKLFMNGFSRNIVVDLKENSQLLAIGFPVVEASCKLFANSYLKLQVQKKLVANVETQATLEYIAKQGLETNITGAGKVKQLD